MKRIIRMGSRESKLAVAQAQLVAGAIEKRNPDIEIKLVTMKSTGDILLSQSLEKIGGKGLFIKELEQSLLNGEVDICVHSYKDMPMEETPGLLIAALSQREDPRDAFLLPEGHTEPDLTKPVGSSSSRRSIQLRELYPGVSVAPVRGNVLTRLRKLDEGEFSALTLAYAGLIRLGLSSRADRIFSPEEILPAASQGILAVQGRCGEDYSYLNGFHSKESEIISQAERAFVRALEGGCTQPSAAYAVKDGEHIKLCGLYVDEQTGGVFRGECEGHINDAGILGKTLAAELLRKAGRLI